MRQNYFSGDKFFMASVQDILDMGGDGSLKEILNPSQCIDFLLRRDALYWRKGLIGMMDKTVKDRDFQKLLMFLKSNVDNAITAVTRRQRGQRSCVHINYPDAPIDLDLVNWRKFLIGSGLVLEEPDSNRRIRFIGVSVNEETNINSLYGALEVINCLGNIPSELREFVCKLDPAEASALYETLCDTIHVNDYPIPGFYYPILTKMYEESMSAMRTLGFCRRSKGENITWVKPERVSMTDMISIIHGLCKSPSGIQESCMHR